jgi:hypothetical protein
MAIMQMDSRGNRSTILVEAVAALTINNIDDKW